MQTQPGTVLPLEPELTNSFLPRANAHITSSVYLRTHLLHADRRRVYVHNTVYVKRQIKKILTSDKFFEKG